MYNQEYKSNGQIIEKGLNSGYSFNNLEKMEQQLKLLESLEGFDSSNLVSSVFSPSEPKKILCACGCGKEVNLSKTTNKTKGLKKGQPNKFIYNHHYKNNHKTILKFNFNQEQVLIGSILGDGCIQLRYKRCYSYIEAHCLKQEKYLLWKNSFLNFYMGYTKHKLAKEGKQANIYKSNISFKKYYNLFYPNGKKIVTKEILDMLELLGLAVWFMDDGNYNYWNKTIRIATLGFNLKENKIIQSYLKNKHNLKCGFEKRIKINTKYFLSFNQSETKKFIEVIKPYIIPSMEYKIGLNKEKLLETQERKRDYRRIINKKKYHTNKEYRKKHLEIHKKWYQKNKKHGICNHCGKNKTYGNIYCNICSEKRNIKQKKIYQDQQDLVLGKVK